MKSFLSSLFTKTWYELHLICLQPWTQRTFRVSVLFHIYLIKHKSLYATTVLTTAYTYIIGNLLPILLKWEVTLLGASIHCSPLISQTTTQHHWYLNEYFSSPSFLTLKIHTYPWKQTWNAYSHLPAPLPGQRAAAEVALALPGYQRFLVLPNSTF